MLLTLPYSCLPDCIVATSLHRVVTSLENWWSTTKRQIHGPSGDPRGMHPPSQEILKISLSENVLPAFYTTLETESECLKLVKKLPFFSNLGQFAECHTLKFIWMIYLLSSELVTKCKAIINQKHPIPVAYNFSLWGLHTHCVCNHCTYPLWV